MAEDCHLIGFDERLFKREWLADDGEQHAGGDG